MKQYISIDNNCSEYFVVLLNTIYKDPITLTPIHTFETIGEILKWNPKKYKNLS